MLFKPHVSQCHAVVQWSSAYSLSTAKRARQLLAAWCRGCHTDLGETESDKRAVIGNENLEYPRSIFSRSYRYVSSNFKNLWFLSFLRWCCNCVVAATLQIDHLATFKSKSHFYQNAMSQRRRSWATWRLLWKTLHVIWRSPCDFYAMSRWDRR